MKTVQETIGNTSILIQMFDDDVDVIGAGEKGPDIVETGIEETLKDSYTKAKAVIRGIAEDMTTELGNIRTNAHPKQIEIEFTIGLSAQLGIWVLGAKNDYALKVKMSWDI